MSNQYSVKTIYNSIALNNSGAETGNVCEQGKIMEVTAPGSKSITNRALLLATLAKGRTVLKGVLFSDDSRHFLKCVQELGFDIIIDEENCIAQIEGLGGKIPKKEADIYVGSAGTAARFLAATLGVSNGVYHMDASEQMRKRPMAPLLNSLTALGCRVEYKDKGNEGYFPFTLVSNGFGTDRISVNIDSSSQFLSALMIASVLSEKNFTVDVEGSHGMAYIDMTGKMMSQFGATTTKKDDGGRISFVTKAGQNYIGRDYDIEPDASGAAYFYAMSPLLGISVRVPGVHFESLQGDVEFIRILEKMGCSVNESERGIIVNPPADGVIRGIDIDMSACSDQAITVAAIAPFASEPTTIRGIGHIRLQESDRLSAIATELTKMGIRVAEEKDSITIWPGNPKASVVETYEDHRMAMGFSLIGLRAEGIVIDNPGCCRKTFENYFEKLDEITSGLIGN